MVMPLIAAVRAELGPGDVGRGVAEHLLAGRDERATARTLAIEPVGVNSAASWPNIAATRSCSACTVGSSP